jgi:hypothetical protein
MGLHYKDDSLPSICKGLIYWEVGGGIVSVLLCSIPKEHNLKIMNQDLAHPSFGELETVTDEKNLATLPGIIHQKVYRKVSVENKNVVSWDVTLCGSCKN